MQQTLTFNPGDTDELRRAIDLLEGQYLVSTGKPYRATVVQDDSTPQTDDKPEPKPEKPTRAKKTETKTEPVKEEPKPEPAAAPAVADAAQDEDLDNFGGDAEPEKELTHEDIRTVIKACLSKNSANREAIGKVLAKYAPTKMVPDVPKASIKAVVDEINAIK